MHSAFIRPSTQLELGSDFAELKVLMSFEGVTLIFKTHLLIFILTLQSQGDKKNKETHSSKHSQPVENKRRNAPNLFLPRKCFVGRF